MPKAKTFDRKRLNWRELWEGPFLLRAKFENGIYLEGHTLAEIERYGREFLDGVARISLSAAEGAVAVHWRTEPEPEKYHSGLSIACVNQMRDSALGKAKSQLSVAQRNQLNVLTIASSIREWLEREFRQAVDAGYCKIWARVGNQAAAFTEVPPDVFRAYRISSWGYGVVGGARAEGNNLPPLFSLCVAPHASKKPVAPTGTVVSGKPGRKPNAAWREAIEIVVRRAVDAKFTRPLERGQKTQLERWLCEEVEMLSGISLSDNAAQRYVDQVIEQLPHKLA